MRERIRLVSIGLLIAGVIFAGCGRSTDDATARPEDADGDRRAIEAVVSRYYDAATASDVCKVITAGFEAFIDNQSAPPSNPTDPAGKACVETIRSAVKRRDFVFETNDVTIDEVIVESHRSAVLVRNPTVSETPYPAFVVKTDAGWLVTGENAFVPPGFEDLRAEALSG